MKHPRDLPKIVLVVLSLIGILYTMFGVSFSFAYGSDNLKGDAFQYYPHESRPVMFYCVLGLFVLLTLFVPLYNIANCEILEEFKWAKKFLVNKTSGQSSELRLFMFRVTVMVFSCSVSYITDEVAIVINLAGAIVIPVLVFYFPIILKQVHSKIYGVKRSILARIHDCLVFLIGM